MLEFLAGFYIAGALIAAFVARADDETWGFALKVALLWPYYLLRAFIDVRFGG